LLHKRRVETFLSVSAGFLLQILFYLMWVKSNSQAKQNKIIYLPNVDNRLTGWYLTGLPTLPDVDSPSHKSQPRIFHSGTTKEDDTPDLLPPPSPLKIRGEPLSNSEILLRWEMRQHPYPITNYTIRFYSVMPNEEKNDIYMERWDIHHQGLHV
jgi:hypothetical protein